MVEDLQQFWLWWHALSRYGQLAPRGVTRLAFTEADQSSRQYLKAVWESLGMRTSMDGFGNLVGRVGGPPYLLVGSHTDTVPLGGHFDGILGVVAATVVASRWRQPVGLMLVDWSCEESSRFGISTVGSRSACGELFEAYLEVKDSAGQSLRQAARAAYGYGSLPLFRVRDVPLLAACELHIDQSTTLAEARVPVGVVTGIAAPQRLEISITGQSNHSGGTAMAQRRDALAAMAQVVATVEALSVQGESKGLRSTVTALTSGGAANVIPGTAGALVDVRAQTEQGLRWYYEELDRLFRHLEKSRQITATRRVISAERPGMLDGAIQTTVAEACGALAVPFIALPSWASHDSLTLSRHLPTGMVFVRNPTGVSHNVAEEISPDDILTGIQVFEHVLITLAERTGTLGGSRSSTYLPAVAEPSDDEETRG